MVCAAGPASGVGTLVRLARNRGWVVQVMATPAAVAHIDVEALEEQTGRPVRSQHRVPGDLRSPKADAIIAPATFNTINKLANGIADNYVLDVANEAIGLGVPTVILPFVNSAYAARAPFRRSVEQLRDEGVPVLLGPGAFEPHEAGTGAALRSGFPWQLAMDHVEKSSPRAPG
ncbi:flavoprotein [Nocardiopsis sp. FIRDI 009]|uniref:flavoprotein n=1 Tax=Nocardiopsis sp. FIRDI 009 TaxID=714197 RepID=UPI0035156CBE